MYPVHDVDALLLIATTLSSKRRPAELVEIIAAADLLQVAIPDEARLVESFERLSRHGMICARDGGFSLTPAAEEIMAAQPKRGTSEEKIFRVRDDLSAFTTKPDHATVVVTVEQLLAARKAHSTSCEGAGKNLLVPKPKADGDKQRPGQRFRKPLPARKRRT
jgi:hypothetical protein